MVLERPGRRASRRASSPTPTAGPGQALLRVLACGVCRTDLHVVDGELAHPKLPLVPGPPDRRRGGRERRALRGRRPRRRAVARLDVRRLRLLRARAGEPLRRRPLHRLRPRRRLRGALRRRRALLLPDARRLPRPAGGTAPLRRADRLPRAPDDRRRAPARALRLRRGRAHRLPGGGPRRRRRCSR